MLLYVCVCMSMHIDTCICTFPTGDFTKYGIPHLGSHMMISRMAPKLQVSENAWLQNDVKICVHYYIG